MTSRAKWGFIACLFALAPLAAYAAEEPPPVTVRIVNAESGRPVTQFTYEYSLDSPDRHPYPTRKDKTKVKSEDGIVRLPGPAAVQYPVVRDHAQPHAGELC